MRRGFEAIVPVVVVLGLAVTSCGEDSSDLPAADPLDAINALVDQELEGWKAAAGENVTFSAWKGTIEALLRDMAPIPLELDCTPATDVVAEVIDCTVVWAE